MGTGTRDMIRLCRQAGLREPEYTIRDGFVQALWRPAAQAAAQATGQVTGQAAAPTSDETKALWAKAFKEMIEATGQATGQATRQAAPALLAYFEEPRTTKEIQDALGLRHRETFLDNYLTPMLDAGWLERTIPDKPTSPNQKYRLTEKGRAWLGGQGG